MFQNWVWWTYNVGVCFVSISLNTIIRIFASYDTSDYVVQGEFSSIVCTILVKSVFTPALVYDWHVLTSSVPLLPIDNILEHFNGIWYYRYEFARSAGIWERFC